MIFVATSPEEWVAKSMDRLIHPSAWNRNSANFAFWVFSEVELPLYGVLRSWHVCGHIIIFGAALPVHARRYGSSQGAPVLAFERNLQAFRPFLTRAPPAPGSGRGGPP